MRILKKNIGSGLFYFLGKNMNYEDALPLIMCIFFVFFGFPIGFGLRKVFKKLGKKGFHIPFYNCYLFNKTVLTNKKVSLIIYGFYIIILAVIYIFFVITYTAFF
ncbi:hypothetical protein CSA08_05035 [Candidatus Gracilibacteria bacterium]|nr:MAG: hypothetical protein CSA08_05035 [Candidatus Gracilibacteria bacterium]